MKISKDGRMIIDEPQVSIADMLLGRQEKKRDSRRSFNLSEKNDICKNCHEHKSNADRLKKQVGKKRKGLRGEGYFLGGLSYKPPKNPFL